MPDNEDPVRDPGRDVTRVTEKKVTYVVDYDLPKGSRRQRFYRAVARYLREHSMEETGWSTWSVVFTEDLDFAWTVYREARKVGGVANVWRAERLEEGDR